MKPTLYIIICLVLIVYSEQIIGRFRLEAANSSVEALGSVTSERGSELDTPAAPLVTFEVTAYCPCDKCCGKWADGITASGVKAVGKIIAAPKHIPFGTKIYVPGYGLAEVQDRGGAIKGNKLDLLFPTHQEALNWGRQKLNVTYR